MKEGMGEREGRKEERRREKEKEKGGEERKRKKEKKGGKHISDEHDMINDWEGRGRGEGNKRE